MEYKLDSGTILEIHRICNGRCVEPNKECDLLFECTETRNEAFKSGINTDPRTWGKGQIRQIYRDWEKR